MVRNCEKKIFYRLVAGQRMLISVGSKATFIGYKSRYSVMHRVY